MTRHDGRAADELRPVTIECDPLRGPAGSASIRCGDTWVLCAATIEDRVPAWMTGTGRGWVTAEYAMLPASTSTRNQREGWGGRWPRGRTQEIGRLIGRALRGVTLLERLGERAVTVDCDVLQADGGTRTASVTGGFVALALALDRLRRDNQLDRPALRDTVAAVSVGIVGEHGVVLDMPYEEDHRAQADLNLVATGSGELIEVQCTAEQGGPFAQERLLDMVALGLQGLVQLAGAQRAALERHGVDLARLVAPREAAT